MCMQKLDGKKLHAVKLATTDWKLKNIEKIKQKFDNLSPGASYSSCTREFLVDNLNPDALYSSCEREISAFVDWVETIATFNFQIQLKFLVGLGWSTIFHCIQSVAHKSVNVKDENLKTN